MVGLVPEDKISGVHQEQIPVAALSQSASLSVSLPEKLNNSALLRFSIFLYMIELLKISGTKISAG